MQSYAHNGTAGSGNFSVLSGAGDANTGLEHSLYVRLQCITMSSYMDYVVDLKSCYFALTNVVCGVIIAADCTL